MSIINMITMMEQLTLNDKIGDFERIDTDEILRPPYHLDPLLDVFLLSEAKNQIRSYVTYPDQDKPLVTSCSWLLALVGYRSINLGVIEDLDETFYIDDRQRSADIIAYDPDRNALLVVDCTIAPPRKDKINKIMNTSVCISRKINNTRVIPVIFCSDRVTNGGNSGVSIIDRRVAENLIDLVFKGHIAEANRLLYQHLINIGEN